MLIPQREPGWTEDHINRPSNLMVRPFRIKSKESRGQINIPMRFNVYDNTQIIGGVSLAPQSFTGSSAVNGTSVDTIGGDSAAIRAYGAIASGSPTAASLVVKLQESADNSTFTDALDNTGTVIGFTLNCKTVAGDNLARIEGLGLNRKRYLRAVITPAFTAGTSPAILGFAEIVIGNTQQRPVDSAVSNT